MKSSSDDVRRRIGVGAALATAVWVYILWLPVSSDARLYSFLGALGLLASIKGRNILLGQRRLAGPLREVIVVQYTFGLFGTIVGLIDHDPGVASQAALYLVVPMLYWMCVRVTDAAMLARIFRVGAWSTVLLGSAIVLYVMQQGGHLPQVLPGWFLHQEQTLALNDKVRFIGIESLVALGPIFTSSLVLPVDSRWLPGMKARVAAAVMALIACLVSGRQALIVVDIVSPLIAIGLARLLGADRRSLAGHFFRGKSTGSSLRLLTVTVLGLGLVGVGVIGLLPSRTVVHAFRTVPQLVTGTGNNLGPDAGNVLGGNPSVQSTLSSDDILRVEGPRLLAGWSHDPVEGAGFGAVLPGYARNVTKPWNFEAQYFLLLFQTGLIGTTLLVLAARKGWRAVRFAAARNAGTRVMLTVSVTGAICALISNAVDPYLQAPGAVWVLYLPFAVVNIALTEEHRASLGATPGKRLGDASGKVSTCSHQRLDARVR